MGVDVEMCKFCHGSYDIIISMSRQRTKWIIGIDEAGRGPLAGPVVVGGVAVKIQDKKQNIKVLRHIRDSKKLSAKQREEWFSILTKHPKIEYAVVKVWPKVIDRINIAQAANLGAYRVYKKLNNVTSRQSSKSTRLLFERGREHTLLDGSLYLPEHILYKTIIKGDEKIPVISAASIIAKVTRDRTMRRLHKKYPQYGFDVHKGYGTELHRKMIKKFGRAEIHRKSFKMSSA